MRDVTRNQARRSWITFILTAVKETAEWTTAKINAVRSLAEHTSQYVCEQLPKIYSPESVDVIFEQRYRCIGNIIDKQIAQRQTASRYLKDLGSIGILQEVQVGKEKLFTHPKLMQLLTRDSNGFTRYA